MVSSSGAAASSGVELTSSELLLVLSHPKVFELRDRVWYAINAPPELLAMSPEHTLAGRLGVTQVRLKDLLREVGLGTTKQASWKAILQLQRDRNPLGSLNKLPPMELHFALRVRMDTSSVSFVAFGEQPGTADPKEQLVFGARLRQPSALSKTLDALLRVRDDLRQRTPSPNSPRRQVSPPPQQRSEAAPQQQASRGGASSSGEPASHMSLLDIMTALGYQRPFRDSTGQVIRGRFVRQSATGACREWACHGSVGCTLL